MTTSNQSPASQSTDAANQANHRAALEEIKTELLKARTLCAFHGAWIKKCCDFKQKKIDKSIQNALRVISNRARYHLQSAQAIACHIKEHNPLVYEQVQDAEAVALILSAPLFNPTHEEMLALLLMARAFTEKLDYGIRFADSAIGTLENNPDHDFDREQVDSSAIDPLPAHDLDPAARLDVAYASIVALVGKVADGNGEAFIDDPEDIRGGLEHIASALRNIPHDCIDEETSACITDALNYLDFIENAFEKNLINPESTDKYRWSVSAILNEIAGSLRQAAENANWDQANEVLKSRGDNAIDTIH